MVVMMVSVAVFFPLSPSPFFFLPRASLGRVVLGPGGDAASLGVSIIVYFFLVYLPSGERES